MIEVAYKIAAFGGSDLHPMGETATPTVTEEKKFVDSLLDLVGS